MELARQHKMSDKIQSNAIDIASDGSSTPEHVEVSPNSNEVDLPRARYFFGHQGSILMSAISFAGSIGFFLFGYDQGVLGVRRSSKSVSS